MMTLVAFGAVVAVGEVVGVVAAGEAFGPFWRAFAVVGAVVAVAGIGIVTRMGGRCASGNCWRMTTKTEFCGCPIGMLSAKGHH